MKVDFIIAGAQKCGTTALHQFLSEHPQIIGSTPKEVDFFNYEENYKGGIATYHTHFRKKTLGERFRKVYYLEASPTYISDGDLKKTAERIYRYNSRAKIICLIRNPSNRAFSAWNMYRTRYFTGLKDWWYRWMKERTGAEPDVIGRSLEEWQSFEVFIRKEIDAKLKGKAIESEVLYMGDYYKGIKIYQQIFKGNFLTIEMEKLKENTSSTLQEITNFLGLRSFSWSSYNNRIVFGGEYGVCLDTKTRAFLKEYYSDSNQKLFELTGIDYR